MPLDVFNLDTLDKRISKIIGAFLRKMSFSENSKNTLKSRNISKKKDFFDFFITKTKTNKKLIFAFFLKKYFVKIIDFFLKGTLKLRMQEN